MLPGCNTSCWQCWCASRHSHSDMGVVACLGNGGSIAHGKDGAVAALHAQEGVCHQGPPVLLRPCAHNFISAPPCSVGRLHHEAGQARP